MEKKLTIIIPSYNVEKYLDETMMSLLKCNSLLYLDIIIVNDGSTDSTLHVAQKYTLICPNSVRIINKKNGGHGSTINAGIKVAEGKYVIVVDGDDWVEPFQLDKLVDFISDCDSDLIMLGHYENYVAENVEKVFKYDEPPKFTCDLSYFVKMGYYLKMTDVCFNINSLKESGLWIQEKTFYVDEEYCTIPCIAIKKIIFSGLAYYHYRIGDVNQSISISNTIKHVKDKERVFFKIFRDTKFVDEKTANGQYVRLKWIGLVKTILEVYYIYAPNDDTTWQSVKQFWNELKRQCGSLYKKCLKYKMIFFLIRAFRLNKFYISVMSRH